MKSRAFLLALGSMCVGIAVAGCAGVQTPSPPPERQPPVSTTETPPPERPPVPMLDPAEERRLVRDLLRDVEEYHRLLQEKNVEQASMYVLPEYRNDAKDDLWEFVARYTVQSADPISYQLLPEPLGVVAKVKVLRTLFEKYSVEPLKSEIWMTWEHRGGRWVLRPQQQK